MKPPAQANQLHLVIQGITKINASRKLLYPDGALDLLPQPPYPAHFNNQMLLSTSTNLPGPAQPVYQGELLFNQMQSLN